MLYWVAWLLTVTDFTWIKIVIVGSLGERAEVCYWFQVKVFLLCLYVLFIVWKFSVDSKSRYVQYFQHCLRRSRFLELFFDTVFKEIIFHAYWKSKRTTNIGIFYWYIVAIFYDFIYLHQGSKNYYYY